MGGCSVRPPPVVHILMHGSAHCGKPGVPGDWSDEHSWVSFQDEENASAVNCPECIEVRESFRDPEAHRRRVRAVRRFPPSLREQLRTGLFENRPTDGVLLGLKLVAVTSIEANVEMMELPPRAVRCLLDEIIELRQMPATIEPLGPAQNDGETIIDRPTDAQLQGIRDNWAEGMAARGPLYEFRIPVLALITLADELLEFRKTPRA